MQKKKNLIVLKKKIYPFIFKILPHLILPYNDTSLN